METQVITVTKDTAVSELASLFKVKEWKDGEDRPEPSFYMVEKNRVRFFIGKRVFSHQAVLNNLQCYFFAKEFVKGVRCRVLPVTSQYSRFTIEEG